jgi:hypothetical protein
MSERNLMVHNPARLSQRYFNLTEHDWWFVGFGGGIFVIVSSLAHSYFANFAVIAALGILFYKFGNNGRWYFMIGKEFTEFSIMKIHHGDRWIRPNPSAKNSSKTRQRFERLLRRRDDVIPIDIYDLGGIGMAHNKLRGTDSCVIIGTGSDIASLNLAAQRARISYFADNTKRVSSRPQFGVGMNSVFRIDPFNPWHLADDQAETVHPEIFLPVGLEKPLDQLTSAEHRRYMLHLNGREVNAVLQPKVSDTVMATVVTIKRYGALKTFVHELRQNEKRRRFGRKPAAPKPFSDMEVFMLPIMDVARTCKEGLTAAGVEGVRILNQKELEAYFRGAWDITDKQDYNRQQHEGTLGPVSHWPQERICVTKTTSVFDNTTHAVLQITGLPTPSLPHFMRLLHSVDARWRSVSLVGETIRSTGDYLALGRVASLLSVGADLYGSGGGVKTRQSIKDIADKQERISQTNVLHLYNVYIGIGGNDSAALERDVYNVTKGLSGLHNVTVSRIDKAWLQERALWAARAGLDTL